MKYKSRRKKSLLPILALGFSLVVVVLLVASQLKTSFDVRSAASPSNNNKLWVQDSNKGQAGTTLPDFKDQFEQPELWAGARSYIGVYQFHTSIFTKENIGVDDTFLKEKMIPVLNEANIKISLNVTGANWAKCGDRDQIKYKEAEIIDRIASAGGKVSYLTMQSTLSKTEGGNADSLNRCAPYPQKRRIDDMIDYMKFMKSRYPDMKFGMTDADATKGNDYKASLRDMRMRLGNHDLRLDYIFLDNIAKFLDERGTAEDLKEVERFVRQDLNMSFGLVYTANKQKVRSNHAYYTRVMQYYNEYRRGGGNPTYYMVTSWFRYPTAFLPDNDRKKYTLMRTALSIGRRIGSR